MKFHNKNYILVATIIYNRVDCRFIVIAFAFDAAGCFSSCVAVVAGVAALAQKKTLVGKRVAATLDSNTVSARPDHP